jgi:hypothetical protein
MMIWVKIQIQKNKVVFWNNNMNITKRNRSHQNNTKYSFKDEYLNKIICNNMINVIIIL